MTPEPQVSWGVLVCREPCIIPGKGVSNGLYVWKKLFSHGGCFFINVEVFLLGSSCRCYRISYLSTRNVVSVENLTGLFPSTCVTLVT